MQRLVDAGTPNAFINDPQPTKEKYYAVQDMHPKTLSVCFVLETSTRLKNPLIVYRDLMEVVMESGAPNAALHLKIVAMHEDRIKGNETAFLTAIRHFSHGGQTTSFRRAINAYNTGMTEAPA